MNNIEKIKLGTVLKELRKENDLTLEEVANKLGITHKSVQFWEQGKNEIKLSKLIVIAKLYGTTIDQILEKADI